jgi:hypothetical protein
MKIREIIQERILQERISLTPSLPEIHNIISDVVSGVFNKKPKTLPERMDVRFASIYNTLLVDGLIPALVNFAKQKHNIDVDIKFARLDTGVNGKYDPDDNAIFLSSKLMFNLVNLIFKYFTTGDDVSSETANIVNIITSVVIHELTHVIQTNGGKRVHEKSMIYNKDAVDAELSTIEPNKKKQSALLKGTGSTRNQINLIVAKRNLTDPKNLAIYKAQPEEITAFAHEFIAKELATMVNQPVDIQKQFINNSLRELSTQAKDHQYSSMTDYTKVYRRFLKAVYLELISYSESL